MRHFPQRKRDARVVLYSLLYFTVKGQLDISLDIQLAFAGNVSMPMTIGHLATDVVHAAGVRYVQ